jgi:hypothetical protein
LTKQIQFDEAEMSSSNPFTTIPSSTLDSIAPEQIEVSQSNFFMASPTLSLSFAAHEQAELDAKLALAEAYTDLRLLTTDKIFNLINFSYDLQRWILPRESQETILNLAMNIISDFIPAHRQSRDEITALLKGLPRHYERTIEEALKTINKGQEYVRELKELLGDFEDDAKRAEERARLAEEKVKTITMRNAQLIKITDKVTEEKSDFVEAAMRADRYRVDSEYLAHIKERVRTNLNDLVEGVKISERGSSRSEDLKGMAIELLAELGQGKFSKEDIRNSLGTIAWDA